MANMWIEFVRDYASKHNISYSCAVSNPDCKEQYHKYKAKTLKDKWKGVQPTISKIKKPSDEEIIKAINLPVGKMTVNKKTLNGKKYYINNDDGRIYDMNRELVGLYKSDKEYIINIDDYFEEEKEEEKSFPTYKQSVSDTKNALKNTFKKHPDLLKQLRDALS